MSNRDRKDRTFAKASRQFSKPVSEGLGPLQQVVESYIPKYLGGFVLATDDAQGAHYPIVRFRLPNEGLTRSFLVKLNEGEVIDDMLFRLASTTNIQHSPRYTMELRRQLKL